MIPLADPTRATPTLNNGRAYILRSQKYALPDVDRCSSEPQDGLYLFPVVNVVYLLCLQVLSGVALLSYKAAMVPKDKEHPYGRF